MGCYANAGELYNQCRHGRILWNRVGNIGKNYQRIHCNRKLWIYQCGFDEFQDAIGDYSGSKTPNTPDYTFSIDGQYRPKNGFYAGVDMVGYGRMYLDSVNTYSRDAYQLVNAKVGYEADKWDMYLYGKNIFDEGYTMTGIGNGFFLIYSTLREMGLKFTYRF